MLPTYIAVLLLAFLSGLTTIIGVALAIYFKKSIRGIVVGLGFSAGIMLLISFFELIPESISSAGISNTLIAGLLGVSLFVVLDLIFFHIHFVKGKSVFESKALKTAYLIALCLSLHDFPEGFAMASSYIYSPALGLLIAIAIALHNIPEEFAMAVPIVSLKKKGFLFKVAILSGLAEPAGAAIGLFAVKFLPYLNPLFMSFAAGSMIFISIHELIPMARRYKKTSLLILGLILSILVYLGLGLLMSE